MSESYQTVLKEWGKRRLLADKPDLSGDVVLTEVYVDECEPSGYCETCYSPGYIDITITYQVDGEQNIHTIYARDNDGYYNNTEFNTLTDLIRELERIAEDMDEESQK